MTPAINCVKKAKIKYQLHHYKHDASVNSYGEEAAAKLSVSCDRVFKTLLVNLGSKELAVAIIPVSRQLNLKAVATAFAGKKAVMADPKMVERVTGYVLGGVSPLGQKKSLRAVIDESARLFSTIFVSGGRRGLDIELEPGDLAGLIGADFAVVVA